MIAFAKSQFRTQTCKPLYKDAATCNANAQCYYNTVHVEMHLRCLRRTTTSPTSPLPGAPPRPKPWRPKRGTTVAASQAAVASGAAGFSSGAVILSALVAALALVA